VSSIDGTGEIVFGGTTTIDNRNRDFGGASGSSS